MRALKNAFSWVFNSIGAILVGIFLIYMYFGIGALVVTSLSAFQARTELSNLDEDITFEQVIIAKARLEADENSILEDLRGKDAIGRLQLAIGAKAKEVEEAYLSANNDFGLRLLPTSIILIRVRDACESDQGVGFCRILAQYDAAERELQQLLQGGEAARYAQLEKAAYNRVLQLYSDERLSRFFSEVSFFQGVEGSDLLGLNSVFGSFITMPRQILVFIVTIAMGALGALMTVTWLFLRKEVGSPRMIFLLPLVGSMSAFVIFVVVKAGQITITAGTGDEPLSPFFLSFVGIVSGLLSERAYTRIRDIGSRFLSVDQEEPRWGIRLDEALKKSDLAAKELAEMISVNVKSMENIISGSAPASGAQQKLIAVALRSRPNELFTDIPPNTDTNTLVPNLIGQKTEKARVAVENAGLKMKLLEVRFVAGKSLDTIVEQDPQPTTEVEKGVVISVIVAGEKKKHEGNGP